MDSLYQGMNEIKEFIDQAVFRMRENTPRIEKCLKELSEEEIWKRPNDSSNSVGSLILHLCGNITQYIISSLGGKDDQRNRDEEFSNAGGYSKTELFSSLSMTVDQAVTVLRDLDETNLLQVRSVQGFNYSGIAIIMHVVEHYSYHTGQIAFWTKILTDKDLGFYVDIDLNIRNNTPTKERK